VGYLTGAGVSCSWAAQFVSCTGLTVGQRCNDFFDNDRIA
jgi:hypothetical protein